VSVINHKFIASAGGDGFLTAEGVNGLEVQDCFSLNAEDNYGIIDDAGAGNPCLNNTIENCIAWTTGDGSFGVMSSGNADHTQNIAFQNCTVIHGGPGGRMVIGFQNTYAHTTYSNFIFRDMTVESVMPNGAAFQDILGLEITAGPSTIDPNVAFVNISLPKITNDFGKTDANYIHFRFDSSGNSTMNADFNHITIGGEDLTNSTLSGTISGSTMTITPSAPSTISLSKSGTGTFTVEP
jgi:hypothetical protein